MNRIVAVMFGLVLAAPLGAEDQHGCVPLRPLEPFEAKDQPTPCVVGDRTWHTPWGYDKPENSERMYPLVVFGRHNEASEFFTIDIRKRYPAFYVSYIESSEEAGAALSDLIDVCMKDHHFRIDTRRIYLTGWSAGGSGSFKLVRGFLSKGKYFAAINRIAGQSESILAEQAVEKTAIWVHIGLLDTPLRVQVSRDLYAHLKDHPSNASAVETTVNDTIRHGDVDVARHTRILTKNGVEIVRYTEYPTEPHAALAGYSDPYLYEWLFARAICPEKHPSDSKETSSKGSEVK